MIYTPPQTAGILDGINRKSCIQIARDLGLRAGRARHRPRRAGAGRRGLPHRHRGRAHAAARDRRHRDRRRRPGPITREIQERLRRRAARPRAAVRGVAGPGAGTIAGVNATRVERITARRPTAVRSVRSFPNPKGVHPWHRRSSSTTPPCATACRARACRSPSDEKVRVAHALDSLGVHLIEAGFPASNPKEEALFELLARRDASRRPRSPPSA